MMSLWLCTSPEDTTDPNVALDYGIFTTYTVPINLTYGTLFRFLLSNCSALATDFDFDFQIQAGCKQGLSA
jgi:hypothetical protein